MRRAGGAAHPSALPTHGARGAKHGSGPASAQPKRPRRQLFTVLLAATIICGGLGLLTGPHHAPGAVTWGGGEPAPLSYPLWWHAPFFSQSGLGTEAITIIEALIQTKLLRASDIWLSHSGDTPSQAVVDAFPPDVAELVSTRRHPQETADEWLDKLVELGVGGQDLLDEYAKVKALKDTRPAIAVCHMWFDCWRMPSEKTPNMPGCPCPLSAGRTAYTVARTMFETAGLPEHLAQHVAAMDEIWVPTEFNRESFAAAGIDKSRIFIVPEAIDPVVWSPDAAQPIDLREVGLQQVFGPPTLPGWTRNASWVPPPPPPPPEADILADGWGAGKAVPEERQPTEAEIKAGQAEASALAAAILKQTAGEAIAPTALRRLASTGRRRQLRAAAAQAMGRRLVQADGGRGGGGGQDQKARSQETSKPFVFLSVFKWEARKGWKELLRSFAKAFGPQDNVQLVILAKPFLGSGTDFAAHLREWALQERNITSEEDMQALLPRVYVSGTTLDEATFVRVYRSVDALVIPTHGEGWGRPQMEAMAMELPVISTNWSGLTEFMSDAVAYPLAIDGLVEIRRDSRDPQFFAPFEGQKWAQPSEAHLVQLMKHVVAHQEEAREKGRAARRMVTTRYTPAALAQSVEQHVRRIQRQVAARQAAAAKTTGRRGAEGAAAAREASTA